MAESQIKSPIINTIDRKTVDMYLQGEWANVDVGESSVSWRNAFSTLIDVNYTNVESKSTLKMESNESWNNLLTNTSGLNVSDDVYLLMEEGFPRVVTTNQIDTPFGKVISALENSNAGSLINIGTAIANIIGTATDKNYNGATWQPWAQNMPAWNGSRGITTQYTFKFSLGQFGIWSAFEEVIKPILNLMAPCLPRYQNIAFAEGPWPNSTVLLASMVTKAASGISTLFKDGGASFLENVITAGYKNFTWTMKFGTWMTFYHMIIENCEVNFSNKVDNQGWPVQGSIKLNLKGLVPLALQSKGNVNMAAKFGIRG